MYLVVEEIDLVHQMVVFCDVFIFVAVGDLIQIGKVTIQVNVVGIGSSNDKVLASLQMCILVYKERFL